MNAQAHNQSVATQQNALQAAIFRANEKDVLNAPHILPANQVPNPNTPLVIPRYDLLQNRIVFLANTLNRDAETVQYMDLKQPGALKTSSLAYYKSTKPVRDRSDATKMVNEFAKATGAKELVMRSRLIKSTVLERGEDDSINKQDFDAIKAKLIAEITRIINAF